MRCWLFKIKQMISRISKPKKIRRIWLLIFRGIVFVDVKLPSPHSDGQVNGAAKPLQLPLQKRCNS
jgi:hypothetical protein